MRDILTKLLCWAKPHSKAIAGALGALGAYLTNHLGWNLPVGWEGIVQVGVPAFLVYMAPANEDCPE